MKGRKIQKETKRSGFKDTTKVWGLLNKLADQLRVSMEKSQCFTLGYGEKPEHNKKTPSDSFQVQTSKYFTLSLLWKNG